MRLLAFTDIHEQTDLLARIKSIIAREQVDIALCAGDFTIFGRSTKKMLEMMNALGVPLVMIHGNHEDEEELRALVPKYKNIHWVHDAPWTFKEYVFLGYGGNGFAMYEPELEDLEERHAALFTEKTIFLCHAPPYGTTLDQVEPGWHVGSKSLIDLVRRRKPLLVFSGHIHEGFHQHDEIAGALLIDPGPDGEIIDLDE